MAKVVYILKEIDTEKKFCADLYANLRHQFEDINEYILALDVLYALEKIEVDEEGAVKSYAETN